MPIDQSDYTARTFKRDGLNAAMEIDHPVRVHADGSVTSAEDGIYAPTVYADGNGIGLDFIDGRPFGHRERSDGLQRIEWDMMTGYTGQYGCAGSAHMHDSEFIGGRMERDILANPGVYVATVLNWPCDEIYGCEGPDADTGESCDADHTEGWVVCYVLDEGLSP